MLQACRRREERELFSSPRYCVEISIYRELDLPFEPATLRALPEKEFSRETSWSEQF